MAFMFIMAFIVILCAGGTVFMFRHCSWQSVLLAVSISLAGTCLLGFAAHQASVMTAALDVEILNGKVFSKHRKHDTYEESYQCYCTSVTTGTGASQTTTTQCQTCWKTHYTVKWWVETSLGDITLEKLDSESRRVYSTLDPESFTRAFPGEPASIPHFYTNWVQAVPESLFSIDGNLGNKFDNLLINYPQHSYDLYHVPHFLSAGITLVDAVEWEKDISFALRDIGPQKQVNVIVVVVKTDDASYEQALKEHWEGANKNDVVLIIGANQFPKIDFVRVISWTKNEQFKIALQQAIENIGTVDRTLIVPELMSQVAFKFERRHMKEFEYLKNEISPPWWVVLLVTILTVGLHCGVIWRFIRKF